MKSEFMMYNIIKILITENGMCVRSVYAYVHKHVCIYIFLSL